MRITVSLILNLVESGMSPAESVDQNPDLEVEDIREVLSYPTALANVEIYPLASAST